MALNVVQQWTGTAADIDAEIATLPTPDNWLVACVAWRVMDGSRPPMSVGDPSRNIWHLLHSDTVTAHAQDLTALSEMQVQVWACPVARFEGWDQLRVMCSTAISASDVGSVAVHVAEVGGFTSGHLTVDSVTVGKAAAASALSISMPAPSGGANCFCIAAAGTDNNGVATTVTSAGWTALTQVSRSAPDAKLTGMWRTSTTAQTASWSSPSPLIWTGLVVAIRETGVAPAQPNANWPITKLELGFGSDMSTPLSAVQWTDQTDRLVDRVGATTLFAPRGIPYELGEAQSAPIDVGIRNDDGAYTPRTAGAAGASAAGTTATFKCLDASAVDINVSDFFWLKTAAGALKELAVFQVTSLPSVAGTTTITFRRADGTGVALAATAAGDLYEGIPIDLYLPFRLRMFWAGKWESVTSGRLDQLPQTWTNPSWGQVPAVGADALSTLTTANPTLLAGEILRRGPSAYWPLSDPSGATVAQDVSGTGAPPLVETLSKFGAGASTTADFGVSTQQVDDGFGSPALSFLGDPGSGWEQTGLTAAEIPTKGYALVASSSSFPPISGGVTILGWSFVKGGAAGGLDPIINGTVDPTIFVIRNTDPGAGAQGSVIRLGIDHNPANVFRALITVWDKDTHAATTTAGASPGLSIISGDWRMWALVFDRTSWECFGGGLPAGGSIGSGSCDLAASWSIINFGGEADQFSNGRAFSGLHTQFAVFPRKLTAQEIANIANTEPFGTLPSETLSQRVTRKLSTVNWRGPRVVPASDLTAGPEGNSGGTIADMTGSIAIDDDGLQFVDGAGQFQWRGHVAGYYQSVRATLGEDTAAGEIPFQPSQRFGYDPTFLYNTVTINNERFVFVDVVSTRHVATDADSARRYPQRSLSYTTRLSAPTNAYGLAWMLLARYAYPKMRVGTVEIDPASNPDTWRFCLSAEVADLVTVKRRPLGAPVITQTCRVLQVTPDLGPGRANFTFALAAADDPVVVLGDTSRTLGTSTIGW